MKNILIKNSLKSILMSSIIFVSAVASTAITISEVALASQSEDSFESFNDDWEEQYEENQKDSEHDWKDYLNYDLREIEFSTFPYNFEKLQSLYSQKELLELADQQKRDYNTIATKNYDKESLALSNKLDNTLLYLGINKNHPRYNEALELLKADPEIKKSIDQTNSRYEENKEKINSCYSETIGHLTNGTPFLTEDYNEAWEDYLSYYSENVRHVPPNNDVESMSPSDKDAWYKYLSYYDDNNAISEDQSNPPNNDTSNYGCFIS